jgi:hypothetical protein
MVKYPEQEKFIIDTISELRTAGGAINSVVIASLFRSIMRAKAPEALKTIKFSRSWCRRWFRSHFPWTYKKGTTSGQKLPVDWQEQIAAMSKRVSAAAAKHDIKHGCFIINWSVRN